MSTPDVDEVGMDQSSDTDNDLFGLACSDELDVRVNSVASQQDQAQRSRELSVFVESVAVHNVPRRRWATSILWRRPRDHEAGLVSQVRMDPTSNITGGGVFVCRTWSATKREGLKDHKRRSERETRVLLGLVLMRPVRRRS